MEPASGFWIAPNWSYIRKIRTTLQFANMTFIVIVFLLPSLVTGPSFMSISWLVLELWQFSFIRD